VKELESLREVKTARGHMIPMHSLRGSTGQLVPLFECSHL